MASFLDILGSATIAGGEKVRENRERKLAEEERKRKRMEQDRAELQRLIMAMPDGPAKQQAVSKFLEGNTALMGQGPGVGGKALLDALPKPGVQLPSQDGGKTVNPIALPSPSGATGNPVQNMPDRRDPNRPIPSNIKRNLPSTGNGDLLSIISGSMGTVQGDSEADQVDAEISEVQDVIGKLDILEQARNEGRLTAKEFADRREQLNAEAELEQRERALTPLAGLPDAQPTVSGGEQTPSLQGGNFKGGFRSHGSGQLLAEARQLLKEDADITNLGSVLDAIANNPDLSNSSIARQLKTKFEKLKTEEALQTDLQTKQAEADIRVEETERKERIKKEFTPERKEVVLLKSQNEIAQGVVESLNDPEIAENFGAIDGRWTEFLSAVSGGKLVSDEVNYLGSTLYNLVDTHLRERSGAAVPEPEVERVLKRVLGGFATDPQALKVRLKAFMRVNEILINNFNGGLKSYKDQGLSDERAIRAATNDFIEEADRAVNLGGFTEDGLDDLSDKQVDRLIQQSGGLP